MRFCKQWISFLLCICIGACALPQLAVTAAASQEDYCWNTDRSEVDGSDFTGSAILAAALNVVLNLIFIPRYGFVSAAYTTLAAYLCYLFLHIFISRKLVGFYIIPLKWMLLLGGLCGILAAVDLLLIESLLLRWGICAAVVIPMTLLLLKNAGYLKKRRNVNGEGNV